MHPSPLEFNNTTRDHQGLKVRKTNNECYYRGLKGLFWTVNEANHELWLDFFCTFTGKIAKGQSAWHGITSVARPHEMGNEEDLNASKLQRNLLLWAILTD